MCNAAVEVAPVDSEVAIIVKKYFSALSRAFSISLQETCASGDDVQNIKNLAEQLTASYIGFNIMARTGMATTSLKRISDSAVESVTV